ncbi:unnamed protein product [Didymodactylos carnosus]|uniref:Uncharacterized protein n=1 Tax=Didymodactylos carnosus TaxID=1234261 RepID=A0A815DMN9_9BILA|nr:unnamed protein product [Didymodactylos carnosus]CAF4120762.1 unnamed protein product [Didymodactylos carnosus]
MNSENILCLKNLSIENFIDETTAAQILGHGQHMNRMRFGDKDEVTVIRDTTAYLKNLIDVLDIYVEPYIQSGFRLPNQPYSYYYRSLFSLHNETLSVWIHLVGAFIITVQTFNHILSTSSPFVISYAIYNGIGACMMLLCSAQAHLFHSRNLNDHLRLFYFDYLGKLNQFEKSKLYYKT